MALHIITWLVSLAIHGGFAFGMLYPAFSDVPDDVAVHEGTGTDIMVVEQGIALEGVAKLGEDQITMDAVLAPPLVAAAAQPLEQVEAVEEQEEMPVEEVREIEPIEDQVIASEAGPEQTDFLEPVQEEMKEPEPEVKEQPLPPQMATVPQQTVLAMRESSGEELTGGKTTSKRAFSGALWSHLQQHKVIPRTQVTAKAKVKIWIDAEGTLLDSKIVKSAGLKELDEAALATVAKAAPFPPIPPEWGIETHEEIIPFNYTVKKSKKR